MGSGGDGSAAVAVRLAAARPLPARSATATANGIVRGSVQADAMKLSASPIPDLGGPPHPTQNLPCLPRCRPPGTAICPPGAAACPVGSLGCPDRHAVVAATVALRRHAAGPIRDGFADDSRELIGITLRYYLTLVMVDASGEVTVRELGERLAADGCTVAGRASKVISDSLRWEIRRGRVIRVGRGRYAARQFPRQTLAWMRTRLEKKLSGDPRPVRPWPVGDWRVGWTSQERGRELAELRNERRRARRAVVVAEQQARLRSRRRQSPGLSPEIDDWPLRPPPTA